MTKDEQRIAIAKACGWKIEERDGFKVVIAPDGFRREFHSNAQSANEHLLYYCPNYSEDLNAMREVEMILDDTQFDLYVFWLTKLFGRTVRATAAQRAEAFLRILNLWKD